MSAHSPKVAALLAYDADLLSAAGRRRVEAHLAACEACRTTLASIRAYDVLVAEARKAPITEPDYTRMELVLRREARAQAHAVAEERRLLPAVMLAVAAAAALFVVAVRIPSMFDPGEREQVWSVVPERAIESERHIEGEITATAGVVRTTGDIQVRVGAALSEGATLDTGERSEAHVRFYDGTGVAVLAESSVALARLRDRDVVVGLDDGTVASEVEHLHGRERYEVHAGPWTIRVRGTRFAVTREEEDIAVRVDDGVVEVMRDGDVAAVVRAPGVWRSGFAPWGVDSVRRPLALLENTRLGRLRLPARDGVDAWEIGGVRFDLGEIEMQVPVGDVTVVGLLGDQEVLRQVVPITPGGAVLEGATAVAPSAPPVRDGYLAPDLIAPTVRAGMRRMQGCHERAARTGDAPSGRYTLRITIGRMGEVQRALLVPVGGEPPPAAFTACILEEAETWTFPPPTGGIVTFEQPLRFATRAMPTQHPAH